MRNTNKDIKTLHQIKQQKKSTTGNTIILMQQLGQSDVSA